MSNDHSGQPAALDSGTNARLRTACGHWLWRWVRRLFRIRDGGYVGNGPLVDVSLYDRAWWKCSKCGAIFEAYETPPKHACAASPNPAISHAANDAGRSP